MPRVKLTKRSAERLSKPAYYWDQSLPGFGLRVYPSGKKAWIAQYQPRGGRQRRIVLGPFPPVLLEKAKREASILLARVKAEGFDPAAERELEREIPTLSEWARTYLEDQEGRLADRTLAEYRRLIDREISPRLGKRRVDGITRRDVSDLHRVLKKHPTLANRTLATLSSILREAEHAGLRPRGSNPCLGFRRNAEKPRRRFLSVAELKQLGEVLRTHESKHPLQVAMIRVALALGLRRGEVRHLQWADLDSTHDLLKVSGKTGERVLALAPVQAGLLKGLPKSESPWMFPSPRFPDRQPMAFPYELFRKLLVKAELEDVVPHDLRRSFASHAVSEGVDPFAVARILGHSSTRMLEKVYGHLAPDAQREAARRTAGPVLQALSGRSDR